ncbi:S9 family peptidase [Aliikangiella marina]|uniref:S9 family peptidase n=1 Tax=Aliikangiella marina TaxID=1712262 RepID=A0A545TEF9_9GAMM|nr:S9 family peptidase [Aliikangiella marina]TQV75590.1 S9 family peptidase [Aliikangiella marina]
MKTMQAYGSWPSELTAEVLAKKGRRYGHLCVDQGYLYWLEVRASENGRGVIVRSSNASRCEEVLPAEISVRTKVHEYGGADFLVSDGVIYFSNAADNRLYRFDGDLRAITPESSDAEYRFADFAICPDKNYLYAVRETHFSDKVINELVNIEIDSGKVTVVHRGFDFYSFPRVTRAGKRICWTCWNQPDMPWDAAELWMADLHNEGQFDAAHKVAGGEGVSIFQPEWSPQGVLHYISDVNGWTNIYSHQDGVLNALTPIDRDFGTPQWVFGLGTYVINEDGSLYALHFENGQQQLCHIDPTNGHIEHIALPFKHFEGPLLGDESSLYFCAAGPAVESAIYRLDLKSQQYFALTEVSPFPLPQSDISVALPITFSSAGDRDCHAFFYEPKSSRFQGEEGTAPPLIVMSHGGPTGFTDNSLNPSIQFWTNRGFAVVDVNYGGSTGYGKEYRETLSHQWGIVDVEDCIAAAKFLVEQGQADEKALLIRGGSAGGYTTLCALTFHDVFAAGMSRYGVADLEALASDSHKFEARYLDKMIGEYPKEKALYQARSPIHHTAQLSCPILLLQGEDDKVVPPNQAQLMVDALEGKQIPYGYLLFEGEGHGFRKAETIIAAFNAELYFYRKILGIKSEEKIPPIEIKNLQS